MTDRPPVAIAAVINGEVVEIFRGNDYMGAVLTSNPVFVDVSDSETFIGYTYEDGKFSAPLPKE